MCAHAVVSMALRWPARSRNIYIENIWSMTVWSPCLRQYMLNSIQTSRMVQTWTEHNERPSSSCRCHFSWLRFNYTHGADCRFQIALAYQEHIQCSGTRWNSMSARGLPCSPLVLFFPGGATDRTGLACSVRCRDIRGIVCSILYVRPWSLLSKMHLWLPVCFLSFFKHRIIQ